MIFHLFLLLGQQASNVDQVLDRFAAARKTPPVVETTMTASLNRGVPVKLDIKLDRMQSVWFKAVASGQAYTLSITPEVVRELESSAKVYDDHPYLGEVRLFSSRVSPAIGIFPGWLLVPDLRKTAPNAKWTLKGSGIVNGFAADKIHLRSGNDSEGFEMDVAVDGVGNIVSVEHREWTPAGRIQKRWDVTKLSKRSGFAPGELLAPVPVGYVPFALPYTPGGLEVGAKFPLTGWQNATGADQNVASSKPRLFALLGEECEPSKRAFPWLQKLKGKIPTILLSDGTGQSAYSGALVDRSGKNLKQIDPQATPYFALVDGSGTIVKLWMGFDPADAARLERDILSSAAGK